MTRPDLTAVETACVQVVSAVIDEYRPQLLAAALEGNQHELTNERHQDNFLSDFDLALHNHYKDALAAQLRSFVYLSEEAEPEIVGSDPDMVILVDPLDTSELAVRGLHGYTHLLAYSLTDQKPVVAVVGDFYHEINLYVGNTTQPAYLRTRSGTIQHLRVPKRQPDDRLLVTNYSMRPHERLLPLAQQTQLMDLLASPRNQLEHSGPSGDHSRIGVDFGSVGLCHVASGATDVFLEFAKGFALWDLLPGRFILERAGGIVCDLDGQPLPWPADSFATIEATHTAMNTRQPFIATNSQTLATHIAKVINNPRAFGDR